MTNPIDTPIVCTACGTTTSGNFCHNCGAALVNTYCRQCKSALVPDAQFCTACGTSTGRSTATEPRTGAVPPPRASNGFAMRNVTSGPWLLAASLLIALTVYFYTPSGAIVTDASAGTPSAPFAAAAAAGGGAPDISQMTPRERASRLHDRVLRYASEGKADSLLQFVPMAMASFEMLGADLDPGARYDYGRVAIEAGDFAVAAAQSDTILRQTPDHLLGLALQARTAKANGNAPGETTALKKFARVLDAELAKKRPEYEAHAAEIEQTRALAASR